MPYIENENLTSTGTGSTYADVVKVVRCKDCIHYWKNWKDGDPDFGDDVAVCLASPKDDAFCSEGERRGDGRER